MKLKKYNITNKKIIIISIIQGLIFSIISFLLQIFSGSSELFSPGVQTLIILLLIIIPILIYFLNKEFNKKSKIKTSIIYFIISIVSMIIFYFIIYTILLWYINTSGLVNF